MMSKSKSEIENPIFTDAQICEYYKMSDYDRFFVNKKFKNQSHTLQEWDEIFKKENLFY